MKFRNVTQSLERPQFSIGEFIVCIVENVFSQYLQYNAST